MATWAQIAAAEAKRRREEERRRQQWELHQIRLQKERDRIASQQAAQTAKQQKEMYVAQRKAEAAELTEAAAARIREINGILGATLTVNDAVSIDQLYPTEQYPAFVPPLAPILQPPVPPNREYFFRGAPINPGLLERLFGIGKASRMAKLQATENQFQYAWAQFQYEVRNIGQAQAAYEASLQAAHQQWLAGKAAFDAELATKRAQVDNFRQGYSQGDQSAIEAYCSMVLTRSNYGDSFPQEFQLLYAGQSKELVVQYELPAIGVVPEVKEYRYVQSSDKFTEVPLRPKERSSIYERCVAQVAIRTLHELFESDTGNHLASVVFNGIVRTIDPKTGKDISPCLVTVQAEKAPFLEFDLAKVDPIACLKGLKAHISPSVDELAPVKPIVHLNMVDKRFVQEQDLLSGLDDRTNLLEMDPFHFEHLVCNLFTKLGLEAKLTRSSRDGGVDVIAFDPRPVFGGKYVIQAKRYKNTVDVAAVRDLYGSMMNENAAKGILVTTSSYGPDARAFAKDKPIDLIDGANLLYLLEQQGVNAKIVPPQ